MEEISKIQRSNLEKLIKQTLTDTQVQAVTSMEAIKPKFVALIDENGSILSFEDFKSFKGTFSHCDDLVNYAKRVFWYCILKINKDFNPTEAQKPLLNDILHYLIKSDKTTLDTNKGIYLSGSFGFGKSDLMTALNDTCHYLFGKNYFVFQPASLCVSEYRHDQDLNYLTERKIYGVQKPISFCWDDLGMEPSSVKSYGNEINLFSTLINVRYELWKQSGLKTHFTTNLNQSEFDERYTASNRSRIGQMCNLIIVESEDQREQFKTKFKVK